MKPSICDAIKTRRILKIYYHGGFRFIEPHCYGLGTSGNELLRAYQISGYSVSNDPRDWKLFKVAEIESLFITEDTFQNPRQWYIRNDSVMKLIYCQL